MKYPLLQNQILNMLVGEEKLSCTFNLLFDIHLLAVTTFGDIETVTRAPWAERQTL
jgi:hypothetical protein